MMYAQVNTVQVPWHTLSVGDLVVVSDKVRRVTGINTQRRSVQITLGEGTGTDSFPHDWWNYGGMWDKVNV